MRHHRRPVSSIRRLSAWLVVLAGLAIYVGVIYGLTVTKPRLEVPAEWLAQVPWWVMDAVTPAVYGLLVLLLVRRLSILRWLAGTLVLSGVHFALGFASPPVVGLLDPKLAGTALPWSLPSPLPELLWVPLLLVPLRDVLSRPARGAVRRQVRAGRRVMPPVSDRWAGTRSGRTAGTPAAASGRETTTVSLTEAPVPKAAARAVTIASEPEAEWEPPVEQRLKVREIRAERATAAPEPPDAEAVRENIVSGVLVRVALDRVVAQLPAGTFAAPIEQVAASLAEPGYLLIPAHLLLTQLREGSARVPWIDVADQFPADLLGLGAAEVALHLKDGLELPVDEVVRQLPPELFVAGAPALETRGMESVPPPFQLLPAAAPPAPSPGEAARGRREPAGAEGVALKASEAEGLAEPVVAEAEPAAASAQSEGQGLLRIPFERLAMQLPAAAFSQPLDRVGAELREPGVLLVSQALVLPQLAEGVVRVPWEDVVEQFPRRLLAVPETEMAHRMRDGLQLPLDEVVRQLPPELFAFAGPGPDVRGLESFPAPFQPFGSDPAPAPVQLAPAASPAASVKAPPAPTAPMEPAAAPGQEAVEPEAMAETSAEGDLGPTVDEFLATLECPQDEAEVHGVAGGAVAEEDTPWVGPSPDWQDRAPVMAPTASAVGATEMAAARKIAGLLAPVASFEVSVQIVDGVAVLALSSPGLPEGRTASTAGLLVPLIGDGRAPWPVDQLTLRGPDTAMVLTPMGPAHARGAVLATAVSRGRSLALLEILCRRAAREHAVEVAAAAADGAGPVDRGGLVVADLPGRARELVSSLGAFGPVTASALRDPSGEHAVYLFLPAGSDGRAVGAFAKDVQGVLRKAAGSGANFQTAAVRSGELLMVIRSEELGPERSDIVVAAGPTKRPGLAYRQVERAAGVLAGA